MKAAQRATDNADQNGILDYGLRKYPGPFHTRWRDFWSLGVRRRGVWVPPLGEWAAVLLGIAVIVIVMWLAIERQRDEDDPTRVARRALAARGIPAMMCTNPNAPPPVFQQSIPSQLVDAPDTNHKTPHPEAVRIAEGVLRGIRAQDLIHTFELDGSTVTAVAGPKFLGAPDDQRHTTLLALRHWGRAKAWRIRVVRILDRPGGDVIARSYPNN